MNAARVALEARRDALRARLQAQRQVIAKEFNGGARDTFPRSKTMNLLTRQPVLIARAVGGVARLIRGL
jgi:hypothetical protein